MSAGAETAQEGREEREAAVDRSLLEGYGLRWAVLAAWADQLRCRGVGLPPGMRLKQEEARIKISSGCFSSCEVGCILGDIEANLISADGSTSDTRAGFWTELLAMAMSDRTEAEQLLRFPAVKVYYSDCTAPSCRC
ncbi:MAG: hypothetical protein KKA32_18680 [Actinobacteria bacterium]|nr:hypothetical protein [Actinomycetota bacterium]